MLSRSLRLSNLHRFSNLEIRLQGNKVVTIRIIRLTVARVIPPLRILQCRNASCPTPSFAFIQFVSLLSHTNYCRDPNVVLQIVPHRDVLELVTVLVAMITRVAFPAIRGPI